MEKREIMNRERKRRYRTWKRPNAGRCRNCGILYIPSRHGKAQADEGEVEEMEFCEACAVRCPGCGEWLSSVNAEATGSYEYSLTPDESEGRFDLEENEAWEQKLVKAWCPRCGRVLDPGLFLLW